jgi:hypothetical protein
MPLTTLLAILRESKIGQNELTQLRHESAQIPESRRARLFALQLLPIIGTGNHILCAMWMWAGRDGEDRVDVTVVSRRQENQSIGKVVSSRRRRQPRIEGARELERGVGGAGSQGRRIGAGGEGEGSQSRTTQAA